MKKIIKVAAKIIITIVVSLLGLYIILYFANRGNYTVNKTVAQDSSIPHITLNGVTFHAETFGSDTNQVVIVLHGGPGNDFKYLLDLKTLSNNYFVVFYDQRGTGLSPRVAAKELTKENMIEDLHSIVEYYGKGNKVNIIGHSWGGMLASSYLGKYPETVNKIVLAEPGPLTPEFAQQYEPNLTLSWELISHLGKSYFRSLHVEEIDDQAQTDYFFAYFTTVTSVTENPLAGYFCDQNIENEDFSHWRYSATTSYELMMKGMSGDKQTMNFIKGVDNYTEKILFIAGECNVLIGPEFQKEQMKLFGNTELVIIPNAGHFMFSEQPEACVEAIEKYFLN